MTVASVQAIALKTAIAQEGKPYVYGGDGPNNYDCSGLVKYAYAAAGITLPHSSALQYQTTPKVALPGPGDIVYFLGSEPGTYAAPGHCGVCDTTPVNGIGTMVQAEETDTNVMVSSFSMLNDQWVGATRPGYVAPPWPGIYLSYPPLTISPYVGEWQARMNVAWGYKLAIDDDYGPLSKAACRSIQLALNLVVDGTVGPITWRAVFAAMNE